MPLQLTSTVRKGDKELAPHYYREGGDGVIELALSEYAMPEPKNDEA